MAVSFSEITRDMTGGLISPEYRALNTELHETRSDYGARGSRAADKVRELAARYDCRSILDYGCGKGSLAAVLPNVQEYDPAIPGKDAEPRPADLVVCTDVLEHVEPDKIDAVLDHIRRLTQKVCHFSICTIPASKTLADGRNAHILLRPADWWVEKLKEYFDLALCWCTTTHIKGTAKPKLYPAKVETFAALSAEKRLEHAIANSRRIERRLFEAEAHDRRAIVACYGPSIKYTWSVLRDRGGAVFSVSGAHKFLIDRHIIPYAHIDCDPREHKAKQFGEPHGWVEYWLASCVHPAYLDRLDGYYVSLWHLWNGDESAPLFDHLAEGEWAVTGGGSVGLRTLMLLYCLGYRDFEIHGMDCSYADGEKYAGQHFGKPHHDMRVKCGDRWFETSASLVAYAQQFFITRSVMHDATVRLHGDGLLQHMVRLQQETS